MKVVAAIVACIALASVALAATPEQEKQFVAAYKKAYEAKDSKTLIGMLYTQGADPKALEFYKMMLGAETGGKITSIALVALTADDRKQAESMKSPDGKTMKLVLPAQKKLVIKSEMKDKSGSASSSSEVFVGEADGKLWILVPAAGK
jgi:hypothetical protein